MKYKSAIEILESTDLSLEEASKALDQYLKEKNMDLYEFMETEEGRQMLEMGEIARFATPPRAEQNR